MVHLGSDNFKGETKTGVAFVTFISPRCGPCNRLAPIWQELSQLYKGDHYCNSLICKKDNLETGHVTIASVDCTNIDTINPILCAAEDVKSFPTLAMYRNGKKLESQYKGKRHEKMIKIKMNCKLINYEFQ